MEVIITKTFTKQYLRCPANVQSAARDLITALENARSINEINDFKKLSGFKNYFRICIGQYRVGVKQERPRVFVFCVMERSQIYKSFPPKK